MLQPTAAVLVALICLICFPEAGHFHASPLHFFGTKSAGGAKASMAPRSLPSVQLEQTFCGTSFSVPKHLTFGPWKPR